MLLSGEEEEVEEEEERLNTRVGAKRARPVCWRWFRAVSLDLLRLV